jgi:putative ABC transport system permease protein
MQDCLRDLQYSWRQLRRTPGFTAIAVVTLGIGIAAATSFYAVVDALVFAPVRTMPLEHVYSLEVEYPAMPRPLPDPRLHPNYLSAASADTLAPSPPAGVVAAGAVIPMSALFQSERDAEHLFLEIVSGHYFDVVGLRAALGSALPIDSGPGVEPQALISHRLWREWYDGRPEVIGTAVLRAGDRRFRIVGVAPPRMHGLWEADVWIPRDVWAPPPADPTGQAAYDRFLLRSRAYVRLAPSAEPEAVAGSLTGSHSPVPLGPDLRIALSPAGFRLMRGRQGPMTLGWIVIGLSALVLAAACANLANMLHARGAQRGGEVAVRLAVGASRARVARLFFAETMLVSGLAVLVGLGLAWTIVLLLRDALPALTLQRAVRFAGTRVDLTPDWRMFAYATAAGLVSATLIGALTAWRASRLPPQRVFAATGVAAGLTRQSRWLRTGLVAVQVSAAVILVLGTGLFLIRALESFGTDIRFPTRQLATAHVNLATGATIEAGILTPSYTETRGRVFLDRLATAIGQLPGVEAAALATGFPGGGYMGPQTLQNLVAEDESQPGRLSTWRLLTGSQLGVSSGFLRTLGLRLLQGRDVLPNDRDGAPLVTLLSESAARSLWPDDNPIGKRVRLGVEPGWRTVVGVFEDALSHRRDTARICAACLALYPLDQRYSAEVLVVLRSASPVAAAEQARLAIHALDPAMAVFDPAPANASILAQDRPQRILTLLVGSLGMAALAIAALGVYGVMSYTVTRRFREFGIRLALGATGRGILKAVIDDALHMVLVGLLPGVLLASWATRLLEYRIVSLMPNDVPTWAAVPTLILAVGVLAALVPALRASRVDPNVALREL